MAAGDQALPRAAGAVGDRLDHVVVLELAATRAGPARGAAPRRRVRPAAKGLRGGERGAVGAAQHPAAVLLAVVGEPLTGVPQQLRQQLGQRHLLRQRDVDPPMRRADGDPGQPDVMRHRARH